MTSDANMTPITEVPSSSPISSIYFDGNSIMLAVVSMTESGDTKIHYLKTIEMDDLVQRVERVMHPIFMDTDYLDYTDPSALQGAMAILLENEVARYPVLGVFAPECVQQWQEQGPASREGRQGRYERGIHSCKSANPYAYPRIFGFEESPLWRDREETSFWSARFDDVLATAEQYYGLELPFLGLVTGKRAFGEILRTLNIGHEGRPVTVIDVGKLRTLYTGSRKGEILFNHAIPVGLARDDMHYFKSIRPSLNKLDQLNDQLGSLMFSPDCTPSPIFDPMVSTPQVDCTRFGMQIARYAYRVLHDIWADIAPQNELTFYLTGSPSRLPQLQSYVQIKSGVRLHKLEDSSLPGFELGDGITWQNVTDHLIPIGAAMAYHRRNESRFGMVLRDRRPVRIKTIEEIDDIAEPDTLYVVQYPSHTQRTSSNRPAINPPTPAS